MEAPEAQEDPTETQEVWEGSVSSLGTVATAW